jgi:hypothetical protein
LVPDDYHAASVSSLGTAVPDTLIWIAARTPPGDVTGDGTFTAADIVYLVNYEFKGGAAPPVAGHGDCHCDGIVTAGDVIRLVNFVFKGGPPPCSQSAVN